MKLFFTLAKSQDLDDIFALYESRVEWMNRKGIVQWNKNNYLEVFPLEYYKECAENNQLYVMKDTETSTTVGAVVLLESDKGWDDNSNSLYIHNLVTSEAYPGVGRDIISESEFVAVIKGKSSVRLDCDKDNAFLRDYYTSLGYVPCGEYHINEYVGIKFEKNL